MTDTTTILTNDALSVLEEWLNSMNLEGITSWEHSVASAIYDRVRYNSPDFDVEPEDFIGIVKSSIEDVMDDPETHGVAFPIYTSDIHEIYDRHGNDVDDALSELFGDLGAFDTIGAAMSAGVMHLVGRDANDSCYTLLEDIETLEEMLGA